MFRRNNLGAGVSEELPSSIETELVPGLTATGLMGGRAALLLALVRLLVVLQFIL